MFENEECYATWERERKKVEEEIKEGKKDCNYALCMVCNRLMEQSLIHQHGYRCQLFDGYYYARIGSHDDLYKVQYNRTYDQTGSIKTRTHILCLDCKEIMENKSLPVEPKDWIQYKDPLSLHKDCEVRLYGDLESLQKFLEEHQDFNDKLYSDLQIIHEFREYYNRIFLVDEFPKGHPEHGYNK